MKTTEMRVTTFSWRHLKALLTPLPTARTLASSAGVSESWAFVGLHTATSSDSSLASLCGAPLHTCGEIWLSLDPVEYIKKEHLILYGNSGLRAH